MNAFPNIVTQIDGEKPVTSSFLGFLEANRAIGDELVNEILPVLSAGDTYHGGGGASAEFTIRLTREDDDLPPYPADIAEMHELLAGGEEALAEGRKGDRPSEPVRGPAGATAAAGGDASREAEEEDFPDISEMVDAIRLSVEAIELSEKIRKGAPGEFGAFDIGQMIGRRASALTAGRAILSQIDKAMEAHHAG